MSDNPFRGPWARVPGGKPITGNNPESCQSSVVTYKDSDIKPASIVDDVIDDLKYRREVGKRKYGRELLSDVPCANGKSALENAYEEALDLAVYLKKALEEQ